MEDPFPISQLSFDDTSKAFAHKSNQALKQTYRLFKLMSQKGLVNIGSNLGKYAICLDLGFINRMVKSTIFKQFCGGESLLDCQPTIDLLYQNQTATILDYGMEAKSTEEDLQHIKDEVLRAIDLAASNNSVPVVSIKISGLADNQMLESYQTGDRSESIQAQYQQLYERVDEICDRAAELSVGVFVDAEESWIQQSIDDLVYAMMLKYNHKSCIVFNTYQLYRHDKLQFLKDSHKQAQQDGIFLGAKLVRGAYMEKERARAIGLGYDSPIHANKAAVDQDFDEAVTYCMTHYETISSCCASHNIASNLLQATLIEEHGIAKDHAHINFCQLYGMSDYISFNLAQHGFNVAKYVPYGPLKEVVPYLIRRAKENTSVTGEMGRELTYLSREIKRRGL